MKEKKNKSKPFSFFFVIRYLLFVYPTTANERARLCLLFSRANNNNNNNNE